VPQKKVRAELGAQNKNAPGHPEARNLNFPLTRVAFAYFFFFAGAFLAAAFLVAAFLVAFFIDSILHNVDLQSETDRSVIHI